MISILIKALKSLKEDAKTASFWIAYTIAAISSIFSLDLFVEYRYKHILAFIVFIIVDKLIRCLINQIKHLNRKRRKSK